MALISYIAPLSSPTPTRPLEYLAYVVISIAFDIDFAEGSAPTAFLAHNL